MSCVPVNGFGLWKAGIRVGVSAALNIGQLKITRGKIELKVVVFS
jgi:hypothetical protein